MGVNVASLCFVFWCDGRPQGRVKSSECPRERQEAEFSMETARGSGHQALIEQQRGGRCLDSNTSTEEAEAG